jgi:hypothetical protein
MVAAKEIGAIPLTTHNNQNLLKFLNQLNLLNLLQAQQNPPNRSVRTFQLRHSLAAVMTMTTLTKEFRNNQRNGRRSFHRNFKVLLLTAIKDLTYVRKLKKMTHRRFNWDF